MPSDTETSATPPASRARSTIIRAGLVHCALVAHRGALMPWLRLPRRK